MAVTFYKYVSAIFLMKQMSRVHFQYCQMILYMVKRIMGNYVWLQAENQLGPDWQLMRAGTSGIPSYGEWLRDQLNPGSNVGIDPVIPPLLA